MKLQAAFLVLLVVAAAAKPVARPLFAEWLESQGSEASTYSAASYYDELETEIVCLKEIGLRNCRCIGCDYCSAGTCGTEPCCQTNYIESYFGCCTEEQYGNYRFDHQPEDLFMPSNNLEIGSCAITSHYFARDAPVVVSTGVNQIGTFTMICNVKNGGNCGHPFCDSMVLSQNGAIYTSTAVSRTNPAPPARDPACSGSLFQREIEGRFGGSPVAAKKADVSETVKASGEHGHSHTYYRGVAEIWSGPITITSHKYNIKYKEGFAEYAYWSTAGVTSISESDAEGQVLVNPFTYTLKLTKPHGY